MLKSTAGSVVFLYHTLMIWINPGAPQKPNRRAVAILPVSRRWRTNTLSEMVPESFYASQIVERLYRLQCLRTFRGFQLCGLWVTMKYGPVVLTAGFTGLLSFSLLAVAIGTEYWYIIDVNKQNYTGSDDLSSHSGLWRIYEGANRISVIPSFTANMSSLSVGERHLLSLHRVVVIMLPISLVLLVLGWIFGIVSSLAGSPKLLAATASYFLLCTSLLTCPAPHPCHAEVTAISCFASNVLHISQYQKICNH
ncbi:transmembrane protein 235-like isoform X2 [Melanotaenia boesemani]|uniref:transmembrane protein 235-like isoform X2 n=1 Tax=Melanotaenia boesemani TaxID=1250792 RepID=UPI001C053D7A|nr:transmembrane protein 235-like isoform X2 [Melanotaenia boesemani]